jgi:hypothetical protein
VPTETLTKLRPTAPPEARDEVAESLRRYAKRIRRLKINAVAWAVGTIALTTLWVVNQWQANGAFEHFGNSGNPGDWNPTLWALGVGIWTLVVGIMALQVLFERPPTELEVAAEVERLAVSAPAGTDLRRVARMRLERFGRLWFHVAAWAFGMLVVTPLWALIEWQDNGGFERWSDNSQPGSWEPWILYVGGIWALVVVAIAVRIVLADRQGLKSAG